MTAARGVGLALGLLALGGAAWGQGAEPLRKADLVRLLANSLITSGEVADVVRRNCLAFRPTERDWADIRTLGASAVVVASITGCTARQPSARSAATFGAEGPGATGPSLATAVIVVVRQPRFVAAAGSRVRIPVLAARGGIPQSGVRLVLRGSGAVDGAGGDVIAATDDSGFAVFDLRAGRRLGAYRFEVAAAGGGALPVRPAVELVVRPGPAAVVRADPRQLFFEPGLDTVVPLALTVRDSVGHALAREWVVLAGSREDMAFRPDTGVTDSLGRATFVVTRGSLRRAGTLEVRVRGTTLAHVDVVVGAGLSEAGTGFQPPLAPRGVVGSGLGEPLVFTARTRLGFPAVGREVTFRAVNAEVAPATATTDSAGQVRVEVTLGERVGPALITGIVDSLEQHVSLQVEPGPAAELVLEHNGVRVDGRWLVVARDATFALRLRARDAYGNPTNVARLARMLRENRAQYNATQKLVQLLNVEEQASVVVLTFKTIDTGRADLTITAGIGASVRLEVVPGR